MHRETPLAWIPTRQADETSSCDERSTLYLSIPTGMSALKFKASELEILCHPAAPAKVYLIPNSQGFGHHLYLNRPVSFQG